MYILHSIRFGKAVLYSLPPIMLLTDVILVLFCFVLNQLDLNQVARKKGVCRIILWMRTYVPCKVKTVYCRKHDKRIASREQPTWFLSQQRNNKVYIVA